MGIATLPLRDSTQGTTMEPYTAERYGILQWRRESKIRTSSWERLRGLVPEPIVNVQVLGGNGRSAGGVVHRNAPGALQILKLGKIERLLHW